jgi:GntR family transcriptional regulator
LKKRKHMAEVFERSSIPLYLQIASTLRRRIEHGFWKIGDKISTIPELEKEFGVARVTIRQAIQIINSEGLIIAKQGKGTYVIKGIEEKRWLSLEVSLSSLLGTIEDNVPNFLTVKTPPPPHLGPKGGELSDKYVYLKSVQMRDKEPFCLVSVHIAKSIYDMSPEEFRKRAALPIIIEMLKVEISHAHQTLIISSADIETAQLLKLAANEPTAEVRCVVRDKQNVAIYIAEIIYRGDCMQLDIELLKKTPTTASEMNESNRT